MVKGGCLLTVLILWTHLSSVRGAVRITQCPLGGVSLREDRFPAVLTCEGFSDTDNVTWTVKHKGSEETFSINCRPVDMFCGISDDNDVLVTRGSGKSDLTIIKDYRWRAGKESVACSATGSERASCDIEVFNPAMLSNCGVSANNRDWTVAGSCDYVGAYLSPPLTYYCNWFQTSVEQTNQTYPGEMTRHQIVVNNAEYYNGTCTFSASLPMGAGLYTYSVDVFPGPGRTIVDNVTIQTPGSPVTSCPNHINTTVNINCECLPNPNTPGSPLPTVQWGGQSPGQRLVIADLARVDTRNIPVCELTWGPVSDRVVKTTQLAFGPDEVHIIAPQGPQIADQDLALTCDISNVYPSAVVTWRVPGDVVCRHAGVTDNRTCNFVTKSWHDGENVTCTARNSLFPDALFATSTYTLRLSTPPVIISSTEPLAGTTKASPDRAVSSDLIVAVVCVVLGFLLVLFIIAVLVATRKARRRTSSRERICQDKTDGLAPHHNPLYQETNEANPQLQQRRPSDAALRMSTISEESFDDKKQAEVEHSTVTLAQDQLSSSPAGDNDVALDATHVTRVSSSPPSHHGDEGQGSPRPGSAGSRGSAGKDSAIDDEDPSSNGGSEAGRESGQSDGIPEYGLAGGAQEHEMGLSHGTPWKNGTADEDETGSLDGAQLAHGTANGDDLSSDVHEEVDRHSQHSNGFGTTSPDESTTLENIAQYDHGDYYDDDPSTHVYAVVDKRNKKSMGSSDEGVNPDHTANDADSLTNLYTNGEADNQSQRGDKEFELYSPMGSGNV